VQGNPSYGDPHRNERRLAVFAYVRSNGVTE
jgi:hypothetical protein